MNDPQPHYRDGTAAYAVDAVTTGGTAEDMGQRLLGMRKLRRKWVAKVRPVGARELGMAPRRTDG